MEEVERGELEQDADCYLVFGERTEAEQLFDFWVSCYDGLPAGRVGLVGGGPEEVVPAYRGELRGGCGGVQCGV